MAPGVELRIPGAQLVAITALRLDPATAKGQMELRTVRLSNAEGGLLQEWTFD